MFAHASHLNTFDGRHAVDARRQPKTLRALFSAPLHRHLSLITIAAWLVLIFIPTTADHFAVARKMAAPAHVNLASNEYADAERADARPITCGTERAEAISDLSVPSFDARKADARVTEITCTLAQMVRTGAMDLAFYSYVSGLRRDAARAITKNLHSGCCEGEARIALALLEAEMARVESQVSGD